MIDTHAHLDFPQFDQDREKVIQRAFLNGVKKIINVGCNLERARASVELAEKYDNICAAVGIHPTNVAFVGARPLAGAPQELKKIAKHPKVVAIGEIGLDYFHLDSDERDARDIPDGEIKELKAKQKELFIAQLELAQDLDLPVIIHCRPSDESGDAYEDLLDILKNNGIAASFFENNALHHSQKIPRNDKKIKGVIHCFSGTLEHAKQFLDLGFYISFTGNITYTPRGGALRGDKRGDSELTNVVREVPLEKILVETDCPFLAPVSTQPSIRGGPAPMRGKRNEPLFVKYVAEKIAEIKKIDVEEVEKITDKNAEKLFRI